MPGKGLGIEAIEKDSPAYVAGLEPGMVITRCNDIDIVDDEKLGEAIMTSGGVLRMELLDAIDGEPIETNVVMKKLIKVAY